MPETPTLATLIRRAIETNRASLHTAMPGVVTAVSASNGEVDVQPQFSVPLTLEDGEPDQIDLPVIPDVSLLWPRSSGFSMRTPVQVGDTVLLVFCERDLGVWRTQGEPGVPGDDRPHTISGAVAIPGLFTEAAAPSIPANLELGHEATAAAVIEITTGEIRLTRGATENVARADRVETEIQRIISAIAAAPVTAGDGGAAFKAGILAGVNNPITPNSTACDNVRGT